MKNSIRITGGILKGKKIPFDHRKTLRPTSSKLREILFNWVQFDIYDYECLDLFAGTGALGIEAISRGANKTVFIELNKKNYLQIKSLIKELGIDKKSLVLFKDCMNWIKLNDLSKFDLIFLDPPFNNNLEMKTLEILSNNKSLKPSCKIYLEFSKFSKIELPISFKILKEKNLGDVKSLFLKYEN